MGVADPISDLTGFATNFTHCHNFPPPFWALTKKRVVSIAGAWWTFSEQETAVVS